jgi:hypothetical protein
MTIRTMGAESSLWADRQTDTYKLTHSHSLLLSLSLSLTHSLTHTLSLSRTHEEANIRFSQYFESV